MQINDPKMIEKVIVRGIKLQEEMSHLKNASTERSVNNPQLLWENFKEEIRKIAKSQDKKAYHKVQLRIRNKEKD